MTRAVKKIGDRMLAGVATKATAKGGCSPSCQTYYSCDDSGNLYSQQCCYSGNCSYYCSSWNYAGTCW
ncbi:hypothetical protein [Catenulispora subtropica]|uniref:Uncharacterized protein n=1 Tax=Catenulispora subtropica TaxID=450798 RepID=A0ABN2QY42_9ACTN